MDELLLLGLNVRIVRKGPRRLECHNPGSFTTALLVLPAIVWLLGAIGLLYLVVAAGVRDLLLPAGIAVLAAAVFLGLARFRLRRMGVFVLDADAGTLSKLRRGREVARWPLSAVSRFEAIWDPLEMGGGFQYWLCARVPGPLRVRLGLGDRDEIEPLLRLLASWGLPVRELPAPRATPR